MTIIRKKRKHGNEIFSPFENQGFGKDICFLCGVDLTSLNRTEEHVIPSWVQDRFHLRNTSLHLLNGTTIPYRQLTIPCCVLCNTHYLAPLENTLALTVGKGADEVRRLDKQVLFLWLGKIFYGLMYKEFLLPQDRRQPEQGSIVSPQQLEHFKTHHLFLQSVRAPITFEGFFPASIFVYDVQTPAQKEEQFAFRDSFAFLTMAIRLGSVGIIGALQDGSAQTMLFKRDLSKFQRLRLHPLQFAELTAQFFYKATLLNRIPKYLTMGAGTFKVFQMPLGGWSSKPIFDDWVWEDYAHILSEVTGFPLRKIYSPPDGVMTWLYDKRGRLKQWDISRHSIP